MLTDGRQTDAGCLLYYKLTYEQKVRCNCLRFIDADFVLVEISRAQRLVDARICNNSRF